MLKPRFNLNRTVNGHRYSRDIHNASCRLHLAICIGVLSSSALTSVALANDHGPIDRQGPAYTSEMEESAIMPLELDEIEVVTSLSSLSEGRPAKIVEVITHEQIAKSAAQSLPDLLKLVSSVDVRQRGSNGVQTDIDIDGGTHDQVTILLNGVNITSPQTGHYSADWPVNMDDIERIEILEGASSRIMGGQSLMGAINIITRPTATRRLIVSAEGGSYGTAAAQLSATLPTGKFTNHLSGAYRRSDGGTDNSEFTRAQAYYQCRYASDIVDAEAQLGFSDLSHGANTFYSAAYPDQHDEMQRYIASASATIKTPIRVEPMVYWHRLTDHYELVHGESFGENHHRTDVTGARLNATAQWVAGRTSIGAETRYEHLISTALGTPLDESKWHKVPGEDDIYYKKGVSRTNINLYAEHNARIGRLDVSAGLIASMNTGLDHTFRLYPGIDAAYGLNDHLRLNASWSMAYRMPTFTDLYYKSVVLEGNKDMRPEKMRSLQASISYTSSVGTAALKGFYHKGNDMIDWVMFTPDDIFHATGFDLDNIGYKVSGALFLSELCGERQPLQTFTVDYTYIHQHRHDDIEIYKSNYALEYLRHKLTATLRHRIIKDMEASWSFRWADRMGSYIVYENAQSTGQLRSYRPYGVLDLRVDYRIGQLLIYATANNLTGHRYYDFGNIPQPGLWLMGGVKVTL